MKTIGFLFLVISTAALGQTKDSTLTFKKRVLETTEVDFLLSYYKQDGKHSAVGGGVGSEDLSDIASNIVVALPLNDDDVLTIDAGVTTYTSASSSNTNPLDKSDRKPTPWQTSSGASESDQLFSLTANYSHSSNDRNKIWNADISFSNEYDYTSFGFGGGYTQLFNHKNTEISIKGNAYIDQWRPIYPKELDLTLGSVGNSSVFGYTIYNENGLVSNLYHPIAFEKYSSSNRNSYSLSLAFSQILTKKIQMSVFMDILSQQGLLATPYQRVYFADKANFYVGDPQYISVYTTTLNNGAFQLADDNENLPKTRFKIPIGTRFNFYINQFVVAKTYYRYYFDDWGIRSHTFFIDVPIKISEKFTLNPMYRYYKQTASDYFAPYEQHLSTERYYTSDYDLSKFNSNQYGLGISYLDIFTSAKIFILGLKSIDLRFNHYQRSDGLSSNIGTLGFKFLVD